MTGRKTITRRRVLTGVLSAVGAGALLCVGGGILATRAPATPWITTHCGDEDKMSDKILVTYASRAGSTAGVAEAIGRALCDMGLAADVLPAKGVRDLSAYRAVVVGSAIYVGRWLGDAAKLVEAQQAALRSKPVAYFSVCLTAKDDTEEARNTMATFTAPQRALVTPAAEAHFAGALDFSTQSFLNRMIVKAMKAPQGDFRDFEAIRAWAQGLPAALGL